MREESLRKELYAANENRARIYYFLFDEMRKELGEERAKEIMKRAIYRRGEELGEKFKSFAPRDFEGLKEAFVGGVPDGGQMFLPKVGAVDSSGMDVEFYNCPLKNAWREMGLSPEDCSTMCEIARVIDNGAFESAGFDFSVEALPEGEMDCCKLKVRRK